MLRRAGRATRRFTHEQFLAREAQRKPPAQLLRLNIESPASSAQPSEVATVYVQGFMTRSDSDAAWMRWTQTHPIWWSGAVFGFGWGTGGEGDRFGRKWLPMATVGVACASTVAPVSTAIGAAVVGDVVANAARLYRHWRTVEDNSLREAARLAEALHELGRRTPYRLVAHSLGCRLSLEATSLLPAGTRPRETHFCAAAVTPGDATSLLPTGASRPRHASRQEVLTFRKRRAEDEWDGASADGAPQPSLRMRYTHNAAHAGLGAHCSRHIPQTAERILDAPKLIDECADRDRTRDLHSRPRLAT